MPLCLISEEPQELFDHVVLKLAEQGRKAFVYGQPSKTHEMAAERYPVFLAPNGDRCAVGWCFTDEALEVLKAGDNLRLAASDAIGVLEGKLFATTVSIEFLKELADCHDAANTRRDVRERLLLLAVDMKLDGDGVAAAMTDEWCAAGIWV